MNLDDFDALFDSFAATADRLETLPSYDVGDIGAEADRIHAIRHHLAVPERSIRSDPWLARIARTTLVDGKRWRRVRVVDDPLTDYQRIELVSLVEAQACGDDNHVVDRAVVGDLPDMWLFDAGLPGARAVVMRYDAAGRWLGADLVDDPRAVSELATSWRRALGLAQPLNVFLAARGQEQARVARA